MFKNKAWIVYSSLLLSGILVAAFVYHKSAAIDARLLSEQSRIQPREITQQTLTNAAMDANSAFQYAGYILSLVLTIGGIYLFRIAQRRQEQLEEAVRAAQNKAEFISTLSQELRLPLSGMIGLTSVLLQDNTLVEPAVGIAKTIKRTAAALLETMDDLIELSQLNAGEVQQKKISFSLREAMENHLNTAMMLAGEKGLALEVIYKGDLSPRVIGDPDTIGRILKKLVYSTVNRMDVGFIKVDLNCKKKDRNTVLLSITVADSNAGTTPKTAENYAQEDTAQDDDLSLHFGGIGLSLSVTKELVAQAGGVLGVGNGQTAGSNFWFTLPLEIDSANRSAFAIAGKDKRLQAQDVRVLVAEDHPLNQAYIRKFISSAGFRSFQVVETGTDAVRHALSGDYDIVLMDCHMGDIDGYEAATRIRDAEKSTGRHIPIVAMTANILADEREKCRRHGIDDYINKPIDAEFLRMVFGRWIIMETPVRKEESAAGSIIPPADVIDLSMLRTVAGNDLQTEKELVALFIQQSNANLQTLLSNCTDGENATWQEAAHQFKGGASNIGAERLRKLCAQAQVMFDSSARERQIICKKIEAAYQKVRESLDQNDLL